jgi:hypothetical protein
MNTALTAVDNTPMEVDLVYGAQYTNATFLVNFYFAELEVESRLLLPQLR